MDGNPKTFCRWRAEVTFRSGRVHTIEGGPERFAWALDVADDQVQEACFQRALATTGDDLVISVDLHLHEFETDATE